MTRSQEAPIIGVIADPKLKENGLCEMMRIARCVAIAPVDSVMHRMLDMSCPVRTLDMTLSDLRTVVKSLMDRGLRLDAIVSLRDWNVEQAAIITAEMRRERGLFAPSPAAFQYVQDKSSFRLWLDSVGLKLKLPLQPVPSKKLQMGLDEAEFKDIVADTTREHGQLILKPNRGSCSQFVVKITNASCLKLHAAWKTYKSCENFRGGDFILEKWIDGDEYALESVVTDRVIGHFLAGYQSPPEGRYHAMGASVPPVPLLTNGQCDLLKTLSESLHAGLGLNFLITHMELKWPKNAPAPSIIELNPRLAGGMLPEMYRLVYGAELYKATAMLALGQVPGDEVLRLAPLADLAVDQFLAPFSGKVCLASQPNMPLSGPHDRFSVLSPLESTYNGELSDEDLRAWSLSSGKLGKADGFDDLFRHLSNENETRIRNWLAIVSGSTVRPR